MEQINKKDEYGKPISNLFCITLDNIEDHELIESQQVYEIKLGKDFP